MWPGHLDLAQDLIRLQRRRPRTSTRIKDFNDLLAIHVPPRTNHDMKATFNKKHQHRQLVPKDARHSIDADRRSGTVDVRPDF